MNAVTVRRNTIIKADTIEKAAAFLKGNVVLTGAWLLAIGSMFVVRPDSGYLSYIDWKTLGILWSLMAIMQVFQHQGVFEIIGGRLLARTRSAGQLSAVLVLLCFFMGMLITNDVALLTFVPFAIMLLVRCGRQDLLIPVIVLQTIAANLGSMMLQIGNPQNLYLYGISHMGAVQFIILMLPYTAISLGLIALCLLYVSRRKCALHTGSLEFPPEVRNEVKDADHQWKLVYAGLFALSIATVARFVPWIVLVGLVLVATYRYNRELLLKVDYSLLLTFVGFFIFTGNMTHMSSVSGMLAGVIAGREVLVSIIASQFISNVPAALLLSNFTGNASALIIGTNLGGLGTLIASMASLISFKLYANTVNANKAKYIMVFTVLNIGFLAVLMCAYFI